MEEREMTNIEFDFFLEQGNLSVQILSSRKSRLEDAQIQPAEAVFPPAGFSSVNGFGDGCLKGVCVCVSWLIAWFFDVEVIGFQISFLNKRMFSKALQRDGK